MNIAVLAFFLFSCGCSGPGIGGRRKAPENRDPNAAVIVETRSYSLGKIPDRDAEQEFYDFVAASADSARKSVLGDSRADVGFNYTLTPRGAVYPFSEIEIACLIKAGNVRRYGQSLCSGMFNLIDGRFAAPEK